MLPRDLTNMILEFGAAPTISELLYKCWKHSQKFDQGFETVLTYMIQPLSPLGRKSFNGHHSIWFSNMTYKLTRRNYSDTEVGYESEIEVVWNCSNGEFFIFNKQYLNKHCVPLNFRVLDTMPRSVMGAPDFFVGFVAKAILGEEFDTPVELQCKELNYGNHGYDTKTMLSKLEQLTLDI